VADLPLHHGDPFDRLLVAQALEERLTVVSGDRALTAYGVPMVW
jgi:PIN domain nuclease of toxin-antitoxin system